MFDAPEGLGQRDRRYATSFDLERVASGQPQTPLDAALAQLRVIDHSSHGGDQRLTPGGWDEEARTTSVERR